MHSTGTKERGFKCPFPGCPRIYASKYNVRRHTTYSHPDYHQFQCPTCLKVLSSKQNYKQHQFIHTGARPFACHICGDGFRQSSQLTYHLRDHFEEARKVPISNVPFTQLTTMLSFSNDPQLNPAARPQWSVNPAEPVALPSLEEKQLQALSVEAAAVGLHISQA